jgi:hypothetical protein
MIHKHNYKDVLSLQGLCYCVYYIVKNTRASYGDGDVQTDTHGWTQGWTDVHLLGESHMQHN